MNSSLPTSERKIYFYRALPLDGDNPKPLSASEVCSEINNLAGSSDFYLDEGEDRITCAEVSNAKRFHIKLYGIRRTNLPAVDSGSGKINDLQLKAEQGLAESIHLALYPNGIVAAEYFHYGPRANRFASFVNLRCGQEIALKQLVNHDAIERALKFSEFREFRIKLHPSDDSKSVVAEEFGDALKTARDFDAGVYADLTLRSEPGDMSFTKKVKSFLKKLNAEKGSEAIEALEIQGIGPESDLVEKVNLLSDRLVRKVEIPRASARTRELDSPAAFKAIDEAYAAVKDEIASDALVE